MTGKRKVERCTNKDDRSSHRAESKTEDAEGVVKITTSNHLSAKSPYASAYRISFARKQKGNMPARLLARTRAQAGQNKVGDFVSQLIETKPNVLAWLGH